MNTPTVFRQQLHLSFALTASIALASFAAALPLAISFAPVVASAHGNDRTRDEREKREVRAIFQALMQQIKLGEGGGPRDIQCVFDLHWTPNEPKSLLTLREAIDPQNLHPELFCDREERDRNAIDAASQLPIDGRKKTITAAGTSFSYPKFSPDLTRATVRHVGVDIDFNRGAKQGWFQGAVHTIHLIKRRSKWMARFETDGIIN